MKGSSLTITEHHPLHSDPTDRAIYRTITAWLIKELRKGLGQHAFEEV